MRIGLVGYGTGGRHFHAPFIEAADDCDLVGIVTQNPERVSQAEAEWPSVPVVNSLPELIDAGVDAVAISTPPASRRELVLEAVGRGVHVVADKPFAPDAASAVELIDAAEAAGVVLNVFHNRRWDTDIRTLAAVLGEGLVLTPWRFDSRFDFDDPATLEMGPSGGLLRDIGSHLVDQALWLFGAVDDVYADLDWVGENDQRTDAGFALVLHHRAGVHSHLSASKVNALISRELRLLGSGGSYVSDQTDVQAQAVFAGLRPSQDPAGWGYEARPRWGSLTVPGAAPLEIPSEQGRYHDFYSQFARACAGSAAEPVPAIEGLAVLEVLDAARASAASGQVVAVAHSR